MHAPDRLAAAPPPGCPPDPLTRTGRGPTRWLTLAALAAGLAGCLPDADRSIEAYSAEVASRRDAQDPSAPDAQRDDQFAPEPLTCSADGGAALEVTFNNLYVDRSVDLFWVDGGCVERPYASIPPGGRHLQPTFRRHVWRIRDGRSGAVLRDYYTDDNTPGPDQVTVP